MASQTVTAPVSLLQFPQEVIPSSFVDALKQGWRIVTEDSKLLGSYRCGTATLEHDGRRIAVAYFADGDGYHFGSVKAL